MTPDEQSELDQIKQELRQTKALLEQEKGKRIAIERDSYEVKRQAKLTEAQAAALKGETENSLLEAAEQMKVALAVSQGIWALGQLGKSYIATKTAAARMVFRENQSLLLMEQVINAQGKGDTLALQVGLDKMKAMITTIRGDGERARQNAWQASLVYGIKKFDQLWETTISEDNQVHGA